MTRERLSPADVRRGIDFLAPEKSATSFRGSDTVGDAAPQNLVSAARSDSRSDPEDGRANTRERPMREPSQSAEVPQTEGVDVTGGERPAQSDPLPPPVSFGQQFEHDSPEWHAIRARHVGSSEVAALFDLPDADVPNYMLRRYALWHVKAGNAPPPPVDPVRTAWGLRLEAVIAQAAAEQCGWQIAKGGYFSDPTTPGLGCTLDYVILGDPDEDGPGALECKNVDWLVHKRSWTNDEPPIPVLLQHQHQLAASGYTWGVVAALVGGNDLRIYRYQARPKLITDIRRRVTAFWGSIRRGEEPAIDGSDSASAVLASLYPEIVDDTIDLSLSNEWPVAASAFYTAAEAKRAAERDYEAAKNRIAALLDGHRRGYGGGWSVTCAVTPANPGREPLPGELIGVRKEARRYTVKETA